MRNNPIPPARLKPLLNLLEKSWLQYRNACYPPAKGPISEIQERETRQAFYSGMLQGTTLLLGGIRELEPKEAMEWMKDLSQAMVEGCAQFGDPRTKPQPEDKP